MESAEFTKVSELNRHYNEVRDDIIVRHNVEKGTKVRLNNAIALYKNFDGQWIKMTSIKSDMINRLKQAELYNVDGIYKLKALV